MENMNKDSVSYPKKPEHLENGIKYHFRDKSYLLEALRHSSYSNENKGRGLDSNQRLEFLGDSVLSLITSEYLFEKFPGSDEGDLSSIRREIVGGSELSDFAREIELGDYLWLGHGEEQNGGRDKSKNLEDAFEALIAAIYVDGGKESAKEFLLKFILEKIKKIASDKQLTDPKSLLQQLVQQEKDVTLEYIVVNESGPDHNKEYECNVVVDNNVMGHGCGHSKKEAEKNAAQEAINKYFPEALNFNLI